MSLLSKDSIKRSPALTAVLAGLIVGVITHLFGLVNPLLNHDSVNMFLTGFGAGVTSGRWFLHLLDELMTWLGMSYQLPVVNGLLFIILLSIAAGFFVDTLHMQNKKICSMVGMLFVVFPSATGMLTYRYTSHPYGLSILLAVLAVWVLQRYKLGLLYSALLISLSMGIYQSHIALSISMCLFLLIQGILSGEADTFLQVLRRGVYCCIALFLGALLYSKFVDLFLWIYKAQLSGYQHLDCMGEINLRAMPGLVLRSYDYFLKMPFEDYCGLASLPLVKILYQIIWLVSLVMLAVILLTKVKKVLPSLMVLALLALFPVGVNFVVVMDPGFMHTLMLYSFVMVPCLPLLLYEQLPRSEDGAPLTTRVLSKVTAVAVSMLIIAYAYDANVSYSTLHYSNVQTEHYCNALVAQVRMTPGYTSDKKWAFLGELNDPMRYDPWHRDAQIEGIDSPDAMLTLFRDLWLRNYLGYTIPYASQEEVDALRTQAEVQAMPCWPDEGSIRVLGDTVVIKFQNLE